MPSFWGLLKLRSECAELLDNVRSRQKPTAFIVNIALLRQAHTSTHTRKPFRREITINSTQNAPKLI